VRVAGGRVHQRIPLEEGFPRGGFNFVASALKERSSLRGLSQSGFGCGAVSEVGNPQRPGRQRQKVTGGAVNTN